MDWFVPTFFSAFLLGAIMCLFYVDHVEENSRQRCQTLNNSMDCELIWTPIAEREKGKGE